MPPAKERRRHIRKEVSLPVRCKKIYGDSFIEKNATTKNISEKGALIECEGALPLNSRLLLEIKPSSLPGIVRMPSRIVWIKKLVQENRYELGVEFTSQLAMDL